MDRQRTTKEKRRFGTWQATALVVLLGWTSAVLLAAPTKDVDGTTEHRLGGSTATKRLVLGLLDPAH